MLGQQFVLLFVIQLWSVNQPPCWTEAEADFRKLLIGLDELHAPEVNDVVGGDEIFAVALEVPRAV